MTVLAVIMIAAASSAPLQQCDTQCRFALDAALTWLISGSQDTKGVTAIVYDTVQQQHERTGRSVALQEERAALRDLARGKDLVLGSEALDPIVQACRADITSAACGSGAGRVFVRVQNLQFASSDEARVDVYTARWVGSGSGHISAGHNSSFSELVLQRTGSGWTVARVERQIVS
jgi:hypothetical protein